MNFCFFYIAREVLRVSESQEAPRGRITTIGLPRHGVFAEDFENAPGIRVEVEDGGNRGVHNGHRITPRLVGGHVGEKQGRVRGAGQIDSVKPPLVARRRAASGFHAEFSVRTGDHGLALRLSDDEERKCFR